MSRVTLQDYDRALARFLETSGRIGDGLVSVLTHGSMACGTVKPGWSDVMDAHLILRPEVLDDRETYLRALEVMLEACDELADCGLPFHPFGFLGRDELAALHLAPFYTFPFEPYSKIAAGEDVLPEIREGAASRELTPGYFFEARQAAYFHLGRYLGKAELTEAERVQLVTVLLTVGKSLAMACVALGLRLTDVRKLDVSAQLRELVPGLDASVLARIDALRELVEMVPDAERVTRKGRGNVTEEGRERTAEILDVARQAIAFIEALHGEIVRRRAAGGTARRRDRGEARKGRARARRPARRSLHSMILSLEYTPRLSGGMGTQVFELSRGLARAGHHVSVLAYAPGEPRVLERPNESIYLLDPTPEDGSARPSMAEGILRFNRALVARASELVAAAPRRPDVLHFHNWATWPAASELGRRFDIPAIGTVHFVSEPIERWWGQTPDPEIVEQERRMFEDAASLVAVSRSLRSIVRETHDLDGRPFRVVHNGLDPAPFSSLEGRPAERERLRATVAGEGETLVLFAGRLNLQKGVSPLLESASKVLEAYPRARYLVVGEPDSRGFGATVDALLARSPALRERVTLLGKVARHQLAALYQVADLAVVPSIYEPFGYAAIEAMAAGLPLVATDVGGLAEIVEPGETGLLVPVATDAGPVHRVDVEALAEAQLTLLRDEEAARAMGAAGRRRVVETFTVERMVEGTAGAYLATIEAGSRSAAAEGQGVQPSGDPAAFNQGR